MSDGSAGRKVAYIAGTLHERSQASRCWCRGFALSRSDQSCKDDDVISRQPPLEAGECM